MSSSGFLLSDSANDVLGGPTLGDPIAQSYDSLWQFDSMGADATFQQSSSSISVGSHLGSHGPNMYIAHASEKALEQNVFHVRVKWLAGQQKLEITRLQELVASQKKELEDLQLLYNANQETIKLFAKEYNEMKGNGTSLALSLGSVLPMPKLRKRADYPEVPFWEKAEYTRYEKDTKKGETDGDVARMSAEPKAKLGRPPSDDDTLDESKSNEFLHYADGSQVSKGSLKYLSMKARRAWASLVRDDLAPLTFMQITRSAWEYYARTVLNDPKLDFLLLCDDAEWKLMMWSIKAYSCWTGNHGLRGKKPKGKKESGDDTLEDKALIRMDPEDVSKDSESIDIDGHSVDDTVPVPSSSTVRESEIEDPFASLPASRVPDDEPTPPMFNSTRSRQQAQDNPPSSHSEPTMPRSEIASSLANASVPATTTTTAPSSTASVTPGRPRLTLRLTLRPPTNTSDTCDDNARAIGPNNPTIAPLASVREPSNSAPLSNAHQDNLRLERAKEALKGKRKADSKTPFAAPKRQKVAALAKPTNASSIRNICMRQWNEKQPNGQGLASDFDTYFKALTDTEKEPFKKELLQIQTKRGTGRKTKAAVSKSGVVPVGQASAIP